MTGPVPPFGVLVVCVGNVCRSPLAAALLAAGLPPAGPSHAGFAVASAGVAALAGHPMDPSAAAELAARGGSGDGFVARQLTPAMVGAADLVLAATLAVRSRVLEEHPRALRRTFTLLELAALADVVDPAGRPLPALVGRAAAERSRVAGRPLDLPDPYRRGPEVHAAVAAEVDAAVTRVVTLLASPGA